jgi:hypothetical protein
MGGQEFAYRVAIVTLSIIMVGTMAILLIGLFDDHVDNSEIFKIIGPAFQGIVGALIGLVAGRKL